MNDKIALQLYTLRELTARDMLGTLQEVAAQGYHAVEFAGFGNSTAKEVRTQLDALGMTAISMHSGIDDLEGERERVLDNARTLGCSYLVVAYVVEERRRSVEQVRQLGTLFNGYGAMCKDAGLRFAYHNHNFEFAPLEGTSMFDVLVENSDPALVGLEFDVYWAQYAGMDPVALLKRLAGRVPLLHAKDMAAGDERMDAPVGEGILPWRASLVRAPLRASNIILWSRTTHETRSGTRRRACGI